VNEIEERCQVGESDFTGLGFAAVGDALHEGLDKVNREFFQFPVAMLPAKGSDHRLIGPYGVFFEWDR